MTQDELTKHIKVILRNLYGPRFRGLVLYGSVARGDANENSDIDALCLLEGNESGDDLWKITEALYPLQLKLPDRELHVIPVSVTEYEAGDFALFREACREGVLL
ncbi:MAG: nucleotidyltransferase domain-containing protein [bacterium]